MLHLRFTALHYLIMAVSGAPVGLEFSIMNGTHKGLVLFMHCATTLTTLGEAALWVNGEVQQQHFVRAFYMGDFGVIHLDHRTNAKKVVDFLCYTRPIPLLLTKARALGQGIRVDVKMPDPPLWLHSDNLVLEVKRDIEEATGIPIETQRLFYGRRQLQKERTVGSYNVSEGAELVFEYDMIGSNLYAAPFCDITNEAALLRRPWNRNAPKWRIAYKGLCLEGRCTTISCEAFGQMVVSNRGFSDFDLITQHDEIRCPLCGGNVIPTAPGFNNCFSKVLAQKAASCSLFQTGWIKCEDEWVTYDEYRAGTAVFSRLQIFVGDIPESRTPLPELRNMERGVGCERFVPMDTLLGRLVNLNIKERDIGAVEMCHLNLGYPLVECTES